MPVLWLVELKNALMIGELLIAAFINTKEKDSYESISIPLCHYRWIYLFSPAGDF